MKLRNKKTGEIGELQITEKHLGVVVGNATASCGIEIYSSLKELNAEWEDYEHSKDFYYIHPDGFIHWVQCSVSDYELKKFQGVGNYFETKEEAEKAVEKLKAWERLKDKGFSFNGWNWKTQCIDYNLDYTDITEEQIEEAEKDLDLLFGGEE